MYEIDKIITVSHSLIEAGNPSVPITVVRTQGRHIAAPGHGRISTTQ
jgi:hypothetical protein